MHNDCSDIARSITSKYGNLECVQCAEELQQALSAAGIHGNVIELEGGRGFVVSDTYSKTDAISENGRHVGVEVNGIVYDNIHKSGIPLSGWLQDFFSPVGIKIKSRTPF